MGNYEIFPVQNHPSTSLIIPSSGLETPIRMRKSKNHFWMSPLDIFGDELDGDNKISLKDIISCDVTLKPGQSVSENFKYKFSKKHISKILEMSGFDEEEIFVSLVEIMEENYQIPDSIPDNPLRDITPNELTKILITLSTEFNLDEVILYLKNTATQEEVCSLFSVKDTEEQIEIFKTFFEI